MAAELINEILKAESAAKNEEEASKEKAAELIEYANTKSKELYDRIVTDAEEKAEIIIREAEEKAGEIMSQAGNLAKLRKKSVINETVRHYDEAIEQIIKTIT